jgi:hypothetical protein
MKPDLLDALASVEWAESNLPAFETKLGDWVVANVEVTVKEMPSGDNDIIAAIQKEAMPLGFNAEAGAYINAVRSSLDILAWAVGKREMVLNPDSVCFPIAASAQDFDQGRYRGADFVRQLSRGSRLIIEDAKPYKGGDPFLYPLHHFDIVRKHRRLLSTETNPASFRFQGTGFTPVSGYFMRSFDNEIVLGLLAKGRRDADIQYTPHVTISEPGVLKPYPVVLFLQRSIQMARGLISRFNQ